LSFASPLRDRSVRELAVAAVRWLPATTRLKEYQMKAILLPAAFAVAVSGLTLSSTPAPAKGCLKGAVVGGVAGHFAGHHGLLGAGAGCIIGHHEATKHARERDRERAYHEGYGSGTPPYDRGDGYGPH
jgi:hypothetical protein